MIISPEAKNVFQEMLESSDEGFLRVGQITAGGGCGAKILFGCSIDEEFNEEDDVRFDVDGIPVVMDKNLAGEFDTISISIDPEKGVVVSRG